MSEDFPFGFTLAEMDIESFFNMREWLRKAVDAAGAKLEGSGVGMGQADLDINLDGARWNITLRPLPLQQKWTPESDTSPSKADMTDLVSQAKASALLDAAIECLKAAETYQQVGNEQAYRAARSMHFRLKAKSESFAVEEKPE